MSVIFGILNKHEKSVSLELEIMISGLKTLPHIRSSKICKEQYGLGFLLQPNTKQAVHEKQPIYSKDNGLLLVAEGRLDNRDELCRLLKIRHDQVLTIPDGDLMYKSFLKWGKNCSNYLEGKWTLAAFDILNNNLFISREKSDYNSLYYYENSDFFAFSSSIKGLINLPFIKREVDYNQMARLFSICLGDYQNTIIKNIRRLLPAHFLTYNDGISRLTKYWDYRDISVDHSLSLDDHLEHISYCFENATRSRLRSLKPVASTVSGGFDSSSVSVVAAEVLAESNSSLSTFTHIPYFSPSKAVRENIFGNEQPYVEAIARKHSNIRPKFLNSKHISPIYGLKEAIRLFNQPFHGAINGYWMADIYNSVSNQGYGALLMGEFGNITISWNGGFPVLSLRDIYNRYGLKGILKKKIYDPVFQHTKIEEWRNNYRRLDNAFRSYSFMNDDFIEKLNWESQVKASKKVEYFIKKKSSHRDLAYYLLDMGALRQDLGGNVSSELGLELRDPTSDSKVIEAALSIPNHYYMKNGGKQIVRLMMKDRLPDLVRLNRKEGIQSSDIVSRLCSFPMEMEQVIGDIEQSDFTEIIDINRIKNEWYIMQKESEKYTIFRANHLLRAIGLFLYWEGFSGIKNIT